MQHSTLIVRLRLATIAHPITLAWALGKTTEYLIRKGHQNVLLILRTVIRIRGRESPFTAVGTDTFSLRRR